MAAPAASAAAAAASARNSTVARAGPWRISCARRAAALTVPLIRTPGRAQRGTDPGQRPRGQPHLLAGVGGRAPRGPLRVGAVDDDPVGGRARDGRRLAGRGDVQRTAVQPVTWRTLAVPGVRPLATRAGNGYGRSTRTALGFTPGWVLKDQTSPAGLGRNELPPPAPPDRHRPAAVSPAPAGVHRPWPDRTSMLATVTDPVTVPGLITGPVGAGAANGQVGQQAGTAGQLGGGRP